MVGLNGERSAPPVKLILVTGGVISGVGKGIISSSIGVILKAHGYRVSAIKIDPYINVDAGTFSPFEHGNTVHFFFFFFSVGEMKIWDFCRFR